MFDPGRIETTAVHGVVFLSSAGSIWGAETSLLTLVHSLPPEVRVGLITPNPALAQAWREGDEVQITDDVAPRSWADHALAMRDRLNVRHLIFVLFNLDLGPVAVWLRGRQRRGDRLVLDLHDRLPRRLGRAKLWLLASLMETVIPISEYAAKQIPFWKRTGPLTRPIDARYLDSHSLASLPRPRSVVGVVSRIDSDKRVEFAIDVARALPDIEFKIFGLPSTGSAEYQQALLARSADLENIEWMGRATPREIYGGIGSLLVTNPAEALGRTILEAQIASRVVVGPDSGGSLELLRNSPAGLLFPFGSIAAAAAAIHASSAIGDDVLRENALRVAAQSDPVIYAKQYLHRVEGDGR